jgi:nucleoside-diphosphate-sugar epimerase
MLIEKKKILLTGSTGYVGKFLLENLSNNIHFDLYILKRSNSQEPNLNYLELNNLPNYNFDYVINCIGETRDSTKMNYINYELSSNMFLNLNHSSIQRFIHFSTVAVYDQDVKGKIEVDSKTKLESDYSLSKYNFDLFLQKQPIFTKKIFIIRPSNVMHGSLPGKILFTASRFKIRFFSLNKRYINWCPSDLLIDIVNELIDNKPMPNIIIANKKLILNKFYNTYISTNFIVYIPINLLYLALFILNMKKLKTKYKQLFAQHYFKTNY